MRPNDLGGSYDGSHDPDADPEMTIEAFMAARAAAFERLRVQSEIFRLEESFALPAVPGSEG